MGQSFFKNKEFAENGSKDLEKVTSTYQMHNRQRVPVEFNDYFCVDKNNDVIFEALVQAIQ